MTARATTAARGGPARATTSVEPPPSLPSPAPRAARLSQLRQRVRAAAAAGAAYSSSSEPSAIGGACVHRRSGHDHRQRPRAARAAVAGGAWAWPGSNPAASDDDDSDKTLPRDIVDLSLVLLIHENLRRRLGRGVLPAEAGAPAATAAASSAAAPPTPDVSSALGAAERLPAALFLFSAESDSTLMYANAAARELLRVVAADGSTATAASSAPSTLTQRLPRVAEDAPCAVLRDLRWQPYSLSFARALGCPVVAPSGEPIGRALLCGAWASSSSSSSSSFLGRPGWPKVTPSDLPSRAAVLDAADAVRAQADRVRALKAAASAAAASGRDDDPNRSRGSPANRDPAVVQAVAELGELKARLAEVEAMRAAFFSCVDDGGAEEDEAGDGPAALALAAARGVGGELMRDLLRLAEEQKGGRS